MKNKEYFKKEENNKENLLNGERNQSIVSINIQTMNSCQALFVILSLWLYLKKYPEVQYHLILCGTGWA